jgi:U3 small nucleolar RNA-associated protein 22
MSLNVKRKRAEIEDEDVHSKASIKNINYYHFACSSESQKSLLDDDHDDYDMSTNDDDQESDEWQGIAQPTSSDPPHTATKPFKPPTGEELRAIKDASSLFRSNSFKLQVCCPFSFEFFLFLISISD